MHILRIILILANLIISMVFSSCGIFYEGYGKGTRKMVFALAVVLFLDVMALML